ncbi:MAG: ATP-binding protein, partial [Cyanobacteriota bacterium]
LSFVKTQGKLKEDRELFNILKSFPNIVIETKLIRSTVNNMNVIVPEENIFPGIKQGHTVFKEQDIIRSFPPFKVVPAFSLQVLDLYYKQKSDLYTTLPVELKKMFSMISDSSYSVSQNILIDYKRTPDKFLHYSFVDVLNNNVSAKKFKDKIVLIGITDRYLSPYLANPLSYQKNGVASPLVELQAQLIDSLMFYRGLKTSPEWIINIFSTLCAILFLFFIINKRVIIQGIIFTSIFLVMVLMNFILFKYLAFWFPPAFLLTYITIIFGFSIYLTINKVDTQLVETIKDLLREENVPLTELPSNINRRIGFLNSLINVIANDRKTIRAIIYGINNPFIVIDSKGKILWSNGCFFELFKGNLVINENIQDLVMSLDISEIKNKENHKAEVSIFNREYLCLINSNSGYGDQYVVIFNDVTELKEIDRLKTDMMRMVSHELKVPLMQIIIAAENQPYRENNDQLIQDSINILNAADLMKSTISNFLQLNKLESKLIDFPLEEQDIVKVIERSIDLQNLLAEKRNIEIIFESKAVPEVLINKNLMEIVINNLLSNAIKYSFDNNKVIIKVENVSGKVKIEVIDYGTGIKEEEISKITEKFYRASNNIERNISGTGLGLSIVDLILKIHNSELMIKSENNKETIFSFLL